jgi:hypothetical protein
MNIINENIGMKYCTKIGYIAWIKIWDRFYPRSPQTKWRAETNVYVIRNNFEATNINIPHSQSLSTPHGWRSRVLVKNIGI